MVKLTPSAFRINHPEFASSALYTNAQIVYYLEMAYSFLNEERWGSQLPYGIALYVAHNLALEARAMNIAKSGGVPGQPQGAPIEKKVGPVETRYATIPSGKEGDDYWNLTLYGIRFIRLVKLMGAGPIQI